MAINENKSTPYYLRVAFDRPLTKFELRVFYRIIRVCNLAVIDKDEEKKHAIEDLSKPTPNYDFVVYDPIYLKEAAKDIHKYVCETANVFYSKNLDLFPTLKAWIEKRKTIPVD